MIILTKKRYFGFLKLAAMSSIFTGLYFRRGKNSLRRKDICVGGWQSLMWGKGWKT